MKLESITIRRPHSFEKERGYLGEITFDGPLGKVQINVGDDLSRRILKECADEIVAASQHVAQELTANIIEQVNVPAIEDATVEHDGRSGFDQHDKPSP